jgi:hypothetical protein
MREPELRRLGGRYMRSIVEGRRRSSKDTRMVV